jgi:DNA-binding MarR family transcriptional regulator
MPGKSQSREIAYKIHKAVFLLDKISDQELQRRLKLGLSQFLVMGVLADQPKAPQKFVAEALDQTQAAISRQIDILVDLGYVQREKNKDSRREYVLSLSNRGMKKYQSGLDALDAHFDNLFDIWNSKQKQAIDGMLEKLVREIHKRNAKRIS